MSSVLCTVCQNNKSYSNKLVSNSFGNRFSVKRQFTQSFLRELLFDVIQW